MYVAIHSLRGGESNPTVDREQPQIHIPVLLDEVVRHMQCSPGKRFVDGTVGGGGHARAILEQTGPDGLLVGIDRDAAALARARRALRAYRDRVHLFCDNFVRLPSILARIQMPAVHGILLDLGLSSFQVDDPERGFSFAHPGPLDMRMDTSLQTTAAHLVNTLKEKELADLIRRYGEERWSRRIARHIVKARAESPIERTDRLAGVVAAAIPAAKRSRDRHPATRTFQALRIAVNQELDNLQAFLREAPGCLLPGGRLAIISFHSLEDRLVKRTFSDWARSCRCPPEWPVCCCDRRPLMRLVTRRPVLPSPREISSNPRARSARLRVAEKLEVL